MVDQRIVEYIKEQMKAGYSMEQIRFALLNEDWSHEEIEEAVKEVQDQGDGKETPGIQRKSKKGPVISLAGGIIILISGVLLGFLSSVIESVTGQAGVPLLADLESLAFILEFSSLLEIVFGILVIIGGMLGFRDKRTGGIVVIVFSLVSLLVGSGGMFVGSILGIVGGILILKR